MHEEFVEKLTDVFLTSIKTPGNITLKSLGEDAKGYHCFIAYPSLRELVGGANDGRQVYSDYIINLQRLSKSLFDKKPQITFHSSHLGYLTISGLVNDKKYQILFTSMPPKDALPTDRHYLTGPKEGEIEVITSNEED